MTTRTLDELIIAFNDATAIHNATAMEQCAVEFDEIVTDEARAWADVARGSVDRLKGNFAEALQRFGRARDFFEKAGDRKGLAIGIANIGLVQARTGDYGAASESFHKALQLFEEMADKVGMASSFTNIGNLYNHQGEYAKAIENFGRAMKIYEELDSRPGIAGASIGIGNAHYYIGEYAEAFEFFERAKAGFQEIGDLGGVASITGNIGRTYLTINNFPKALENLNQSMAIFEQLGNRGYSANCLGSIGNLYYHTGNYPLALEQFHRAISVNEEIGDRSWVAFYTGCIGNVHLEMGSFSLALEHFERALVLHEELGEKGDIASVTSRIGSVHGNTKNYPLALEYFYGALALREELGDRRGIASVSCSILQALIETQSFNEADDLLESIDAMRADEPTLIINRELRRASLHEHHDRPDEATHTLRSVLKLATDHNLPNSQSEIHLRLRELAQKSNDFAAYIEHNNEYTRITEEINGKDTATKLAVQEKQREIDAERKEVEKHMAVLHSTLPKHIADRVARGEVVNDQFDDAAVLFLDVVGFTSNSSELPPEEVVSLLQNMFTTFDAICAKHNVTKIKTIGDAYMAVAFPVDFDGGEGSKKGGGFSSSSAKADSPLKFQDHHFSLASAAIEIVGSEFMWSHNSTPVQFRIGLHAGPVVAGVLGKERMQYDVWGDTVNVASRMESSGKSGRIHVSDIFASALFLAPFKFTPRGEVEVKGKGTMRTFWLETTND